MVIYGTQQLDNLFGALANRTRREILNLLTRSERSVLELAGRFDMSQPAVTKHLKVLENAGLIKKRKEGRYRYCTLDGAKLGDASEWIERTRRYWEESFSALDEYLEQSQNMEDGS
ncbi:MAG: winged helix-turn-helix transcriptional regulator [Chloroflexi bacterium]|nr:winged helix-turn-helix transcriptional regulator [Chloroflexota bacterium]MCH8341542.1 winged helix-turn-helix transcriptional regulator [Chloroflexota bacterium]